MEVALSGAGPAAKPGGVNKATAKSVPAFLNKLFAMVNDPDTDDLIHWSKDGDSFLVPSADRFAREVLPRYFKHSNFGSFVRQCNMYGFHKVPSLQHGVLKNEEGAELLEFSNPNFLQSQPDLLCLIRRQKSRGDSGQTESALDLPSLLTDLAAIRKHQTAISADLKDLQTSNHALWQEAIQSRERHSRQQETINKILRFLATVFGGQVVGDDSATNTPRDNANVVVEEDGKADHGKGKGKASDAGHIAVPKLRSRLLLEDVKGRQQERERERKSLDRGNGKLDIDGDGEEEDDIEEIPFLRQDDVPNLPRSSAQYTTAPTLSRSTPSSNALAYTGIHSPSKFSSSGEHSSRFTTLPCAEPTATATTISPPSSDTQFKMSPDVLSNILSSNNSNTLDAYLQLQSSNVFGSGQHAASASSSAGESLSTTTPAFDFSRAMIPSPSTSSSAQSNPLDMLNLSSNAGVGLSGVSSNALFAPSDFSEDYRLAINDHSQAINNVMDEKADIDQRTSALESAISKLMQALPSETRNALSNSDLSSPSTIPGHDGNAVPSSSNLGGDSATWEGSTGGPGDDIDLDKFLAQFVHTSATPTQDPIDYSNWLDPAASSAGASSAMPYTSSLSQFATPTDQIQALSPSTSESTNVTAASTPAGGRDDLNDGDWADSATNKTKKGGGGVGGGKKRKSDVMDAGSLEGGGEAGTRRSGRKKRG